ncbi:hypothetical protein LDENG_00207030 [Lucifuga dentata]|nr:hypothetical protein LDENG_00207030 [Lucifuga dentata]
MDMAEASVDDMYNGCRAEMMQMVGKKYKEEIKQFENSWNRAEKCADRNALTKDHIQAICVYMSGYKMFNKIFNKAVWSSRKQYGTSFPYHSLHFLLTVAVQLLKENQESCHTSYRRSELKFTADVGQIIRFGYFASSSLNTDLEYFGEDSCFKIRTCYGAFLKNYSDYQSGEEVLIPPYEQFKITKILQGEGAQSEPGLKDCKVVYVLESAGDHSNLNCKAAGIPPSAALMKKSRKGKGFLSLWKSCFPRLGK